MPMVKMTEMYDLKTSVGKIGVLGVHTPTSSIVAKRWNGLFMNYKFFRVVGCNIRLACASLLPADPLQVSTSAGSIAPQDIMNPILYRAVSNDSWNYFVGRLYTISNESQSIKYIDAIPNTGTEAGAENAYYAMLGEDGWKKAMPQTGFSMRRLRPFVHSVVDTYGNLDPSYGMQTAELNDHPYSDTATTVQYASGDAQVLRGKAIPYPRIPCTRAGTGSSSANPQFTVNDIAKTYVACIVLPPGKLTEFYFRLVVDWYIEFTGLTSLVDKLNYSQTSGVGSLVYARGYDFTSASAKELVSDQETVTEESTVDTIDADVELIMEN